MYQRADRVRLLGLSVVGRLSNAYPEFFQPFGLVLSMNDAAEEPERFGNIVAVEADVLAGRLGILPHPLLGVRGLGEDVGACPACGTSTTTDFSRSNMYSSRNT